MENIPANLFASSRGVCYALFFMLLSTSLTSSGRQITTPAKAALTKKKKIIALSAEAIRGLLTYPTIIVVASPSLW